LGWALGAAAAPGAEKPLWLAVGPESLTGALGPLAELRRAEGMEVVVSSPPVDGALRSLRRRVAYVLLVGDDEPGKEDAPWYLAARRRELYRWQRGQPRQYACDAVFGDLDGDLVPDVPVGRIPARTAEEVRRVVAKTIAFEKRPPGLADLRLLLWAGASGYQETIDQLLLSVGFATFRQNAPSWSAAWAIVAGVGHPLCGWPPDHCAMFAREWSSGSLASVFAGHALPESFHSMAHAGRQIDLTLRDVQGVLADREPAGPAFFISCCCGQFAGSRPCLAELLLMLPGGPVVTVGAATTSHPLPNYFTAVSLLGQFAQRTPRVGDLWLQAQLQALGARNLLMERALIEAEGKLEEQLDAAKLRRDQCLMYVLLGDPATRLKFGERMEVRVRRDGAGWRWKVFKPQGATRLLVEQRPGQWRLPAGVKDASQEVARATFRKAIEAFAFRRLASLGPQEPWEGTVREPGALRLVALAPGRMFVASGQLRPAASQPAGRT
jgi:hypothetical protein